MNDLMAQVCSAHCQVCGRHTNLTGRKARYIDQADIASTLVVRHYTTPVTAHRSARRFDDHLHKAGMVADIDETWKPFIPINRR